MPGGNVDATVVDHIHEMKEERYPDTAPQFIRPLKHVAATIIQGVVSSIDELEVHATIGVRFPEGWGGI